MLRETERLAGAGAPSRRYRRPSPARPLRRRPGARRAPRRRRRRTPPRLLQEPDRRRDADAARRPRRRARRPGTPRCDVRRRAHQRLRGPRRAPRRAADAARALADRRRRRRRQGGARDARPDGRLRRARPRRRVDRPHRQADPQRRQHRDRRLRPRPGDGLRGAPPLQPTRDDVPVRLQRRRHRLRRVDPRPRPRGDALRRLLEDLHDAGDDDQRPHRPRMVAGRPRRRRGGRRQALRRGLDQRRGGLRVRDRHREHVRVLGVGRRPLLDGLGDRALDDAGDRPGPVRRDAGRLPRDGRALPRGAAGREPADADGPAGGLVRRLLRRRDLRRPALRPVPAPLPGLPPAADDGVQRQARHPRRRPGRLRHRGDLLGRAGHQRPALLLPADPPGDAADPLRLHRLHALEQPARRPPRPADLERLRPGRGARVRQDAGARCARRGRRRRSSRTG